MPIPAGNGRTVLVTGINGYIASVLGSLLLAKGYSLRGTSRRLESTDPLLKGPYAPYSERIKIYKVADMTVDGAFDEAVKGVDGIFHTASPIDFSIDTFDEMMIPAVRGSQTILESALRAGPQLTSVVITSSTVAVVNPGEGQEYTFTEKDWASASLESAIKDKEEGLKSASSVLYAASKTASDRAVWKFRDEKKPSFAISTINPAFVIGPPAILPSSSAKLNETLRPFFRLYSGEAKEIPPFAGTGSFVDVRDVAYMHVWAFENATVTDGERYIACKGFGPLQAAADTLRQHYKGTPIAEKICSGKPGEGYIGFNKETNLVDEVQYLPGRLRIHGSKAEKVMGFKYTTFPQSCIDTAKALEPLL